MYAQLCTVKWEWHVLHVDTALQRSRDCRVPGIQQEWLCKVPCELTGRTGPIADMTGVEVNEQGQIVALPFRVEKLRYPGTSLHGTLHPLVCGHSLVLADIQL